MDRDIDKDEWRPDIDRAAPSGKVSTVDNVETDIGRLPDKFVLVFYENRESVEINQPFKDRLGAQRDGEGYADDVLVIAVADVTGFGFWPAKKFVIKAIRQVQKSSGFDIYCDWTGDSATAFGFEKDTSNLAIIDHGRLRLVHSGPVTEPIATWILNQTAKSSGRD